MKDKIKRIKLLYLFDLLLLPIYLFAYDQMEVLFWSLLILADNYVIKIMDFEVMISLYCDPAFQRENGRLWVYNVAFITGLSIIAFKNLALAGILLVNDLLLDLVMLINVKKADKK